MEYTNPKQAREALNNLIVRQQNAEEKMNQFDSKVEELKKIQKALVENNQQSVQPIGDDSILSRYREEDGSIVLKNKTIKKSIEGRGSVPVQQEGLLDASVPANDWHAELLDMTQKRTLARLCMRDPYTPRADANLYKHLMKAPKVILPAIQRAFNDVAGTGAEFIPDEFSSDLFQSFQQRGGLRQLLQVQEVERNTLLLPRMDRGSRPYLKGQITSNDPALYTASDVATSQKSISISGLASRIIVDDAASEDAAFAMTSLLQNVLSQDIEDAYEDAIINGDTTGAQDALASWNIRDRWGTVGLGTASDHRRLFHGLRKHAFDRSSTHDIAAAGATTLEYADLITMLGKMGEFGVADKVIVVSPEVMVSGIMNMTETKTLDVFGANAAILKGQIASVMGIPIIMSRFLGADLNASGKYDNVTKTKSGVLIFARESYYQYLRRGILVETQKDIRAGAIEIVATLRSVMDTPDKTDKKNVVFGYNSSY
tara:strand:+ start:615 stop:2072 length:1458 start_codon:yes stop_codon:yes gene_type:complete